MVSTPALRSIPPEIPSEAASPMIARAFSSSGLSAGTELGPPPVLARSLRIAAPLALAALAKSCHFLRTTSHSLCGLELDAAIFMAMRSQVSFFVLLDTVVRKLEKSTSLWSATSSKRMSISVGLKLGALLFLSFFSAIAID